MKAKAVVIAGYYGFGNAGDELLLRSLTEHLKRENPEVRITVLSQQPQETRRSFGVEAVDRWQFWQWIASLRQADLCMLGGGGLLQESTGPWNHAYYLLILVIAKMLRCRTEVRAVGVDPIKQRLNRWFTRFVFNWMVDSASVRHTDSQRALEIAGVRLRLTIQPDLVFQLTLPTVLKTSGESPKIGLALSPWPQRMGWEHDLALLLDRVADQLKVQCDLIPFFLHEEEGFAKKISELVNHPIVVRSWREPEDLLGWIQGYDLWVGMRYHALVLAALAEKPFIGWGFQRKVRTLCRDFNQPLWTFDRGWDAEAVFRQISETWRYRTSLPERYRPTLPHLKSAKPKATEIPRIFPAWV